MAVQRPSALIASTSKPSTSVCGARVASCSSQAPRHPRVLVRANYDVDVESERRPAPDAPPGRWGSSPPPPPPPPPPAQGPGRTSAFSAPSRREALFAFLGAGIATAATTAYFKANDTPEALEEALDALLEDPEFMDLIADEALYNEYEENVEGLNSKIDELRNELITQQSDKASN